MIIEVEESKYTNLLDDITELRQTNIACEKEYRNLCNSYNKIVEHDKALQTTLTCIQSIIKKSKGSLAVKEIKAVLKDIC